MGLTNVCSSSDTSINLEGGNSYPDPVMHGFGGAYEQVAPFNEGNCYALAQSGSQNYIWFSGDKKTAYLGAAGAYPANSGSCTPLGAVFQLPSANGFSLFGGDWTQELADAGFFRTAVGSQQTTFHVSCISVIASSTAVKTVFTNDAQSVAVVAVVIAIASILIACAGVCCLCGCFSRGAGGAKNNRAATLTPCAPRCSASARACRWSRTRRARAAAS